jgi:hypothetical protein
MRRYPASNKPIPDQTFAEAIAYASDRRRNRPEQTRWRDAHGVVDQDGDVKTFTGECQRGGCGKWFSVTRTPASVNARWPEFCSPRCQDIHNGIRDRKYAKKRRNGETPGRSINYVHPTFDPTAPEAWSLAREITRKNPGAGKRYYRWCPPDVLAAAEAYLEQCAADDRERARVEAEAERQEDIEGLPL